jgi:hypothetical protein
MRNEVVVTGKGVVVKWNVHIKDEKRDEKAGKRCVVTWKRVIE